MVAAINTSQILTTDQYQQQQMAALSAEDELGRDAFLTLLTTQLTNQNPLDPMDNEAFVAQLAQFSSVEGIKGMQASLEEMVAGMRQGQMLAGANLVGKKVAVEGGFVEAGGESVQGTINLDAGAEAIVFSVHNPATGDLVYRDTLGRQLPGQLELTWNGYTSSGQLASEGSYVMSASVVRNSKLEAVPVTTMAKVQSLQWDAGSQQINLEVNSGHYVPLSDVQRIGI